nr:hypothetical protein [Tanacetum cinerariifolium]
MKVDAYIRGVTDNIKGEATSSKPANLNGAVRMDHKLMEQKLQARYERILEGKKRKWENYQSGISSGPYEQVSQNAVNLVQKMVFDAAGPFFNPLEFHDSVPQASNSKPPNSEAKRFYDLFSKAEPLYKGCEKHSTLSAMSRLLNMKSDFNISLSYYDRIMHAVKDFIPDSTLCSNYYESNKIVSQLGLGDPKVLSHPSDGEVCKHFDRTHPSFVAEQRNVRLGLYVDSFSPFGISTNNYSCWSVIVTPYNLSPWMCMKTRYMFLTIIIPGPHSPKMNIDMFLEPLIYELIRLWKDDVETYDAFKKQDFQLKATLMWTVNDFLAYGMLKTSFLTIIVNFCQRIIPLEETRIVLSRDELRGMNLHLGKEFIRLRVYHNWTKRSVFWDLPYWHTKLIQHNLDVMQVEKNMFDNIFKIIMDDKDKIKDNGKARQDVKEYYKRRELKLVSDVNGKVSKPRASFSLTKKQKQTTLKVDQLEKMEKNIVVTLCKLEKILSPRFFDHMEHLVVNFSYEVRVGGPIQYRWMYLFERYLYHQKKKVKNKARVKCLICEAYIMEEISNFCSHYFEPHVLTNSTRVRRNDDGGNMNEREDVLSIFKHPARPSGNSKCRYLNDDEYTTAIFYVLQNYEEIQPFFRIFEGEAVCRTKSSSAIVAPAQSIDSAYQEDGNTLPFIVTEHDEVEHLSDNESDMQEVEIEQLTYLKEEEDIKEEEIKEEEIKEKDEKEESEDNNRADDYTDDDKF